MARDNVIKFGKAKKALARADNEKQSTENRIKFGRTKSEKKRDCLQKKKSDQHLDDHKRDS